MFEKKGLIQISKNNLNEEEFLDDLMNFGIDNFEELEQEYELLVDPTEFESITNKFEKKSYNIEGNLSLIPINFITLESNKIDSIINLISALEDHDDVQKVHANVLEGEE